jgi:MFS family permease
MVYVFSMAGLHGNINLISSGIQYALFIIFSCFTFFFIDHTGRRPLLIYGAVGMGVCHFVVGGLLGTYGIYTPEGVDGNLNVLITLTPGAVSRTVIAFSYLLIIIYALTLAPVAWVYASEVWSLETRAYGMAIASIANWLFNFALGLFVPPAFHNITWKTFIIFGVLCFGAAVQAFVSYPETAQKSLEEIEEMFRDTAVRPWKTKVCRV